MFFNNDEYSCDIDQLGYEKQAKTLRNLIVNCETPYAIGISGRWGSGKTSMMKYIMASLGGQPMQHRLRYQSDALENEDEKAAFKVVADSFGNTNIPTTCLVSA
jgi:ABC-type Mn2+/Zn2+ transport system ATPase subunit